MAPYEDSQIPWLSMEQPYSKMKICKQTADDGVGKIRIRVNLR